MKPKNQNTKIELFFFIKKNITKAFNNKSTSIYFYYSIIFFLTELVINLSLPIFLKKIVDTLSFHDFKFQVIYLFISYGFLWTFFQITQHARYYFALILEQKIIYQVSTNLCSQFHTLSYKYLQNQKIGNLTNVLRRAQKNISGIILGIFVFLLPILTQFIFIILGSFIFYRLSYMIIVLMIIAIFFSCSFFSFQQIIQLRKAANDTDKNTDGTVTDWISNYEFVKTFGRQDLANKVCFAAFLNKEKAEIKYLKKNFSLKISQSIILGFGFTSLLFFVGMDVCKGKLSVGDFILFNSYILQLILPIGTIFHELQNVIKSFLDMQDILDLFIKNEMIKEMENPVHLSGESFSVEFKNVSFNNDKRTIFKNISFKIQEGQTAIITGESGIGKSTIAKLMLRLYDPTEGDIFINQVNIKELSFEFLYGIIGWAPQENYFINDTILNNVRFASKESSLNDIQKAIEMANLDLLIKKSPSGLNTLIGDKGINLSGGEKQRLALARIFLKNPKICIFDESTTFLDHRTEEILHRNILKYFKKSTKIIITHGHHWCGKDYIIINI